MTKRYRINYKKHDRFTPIAERNENYKASSQRQRDPFRISLNGIFKNKSDNEKTQAQVKTTKKKHERRNRKLLSEINKRITDPRFPIGEQARLMELKKKIILQIQSNVYDQKSLEKLIFSILNPANPIKFRSTKNQPKFY